MWKLNVSAIGPKLILACLVAKSYHAISRIFTSMWRSMLDGLLICVKCPAGWIKITEPNLSTA